MSDQREREPTSEDLYIDHDDAKDAVDGYHRRLHVCPAINPHGVHVAVRIDLVDNPPAGAEGHQRQIGAGLNLTPDEARSVIGHMQAILGVDSRE
ncbi:MAG TPA: hypothetical protein VG275_07250 [Solirubrobacteraceae bacterium]|jgi:hypothetical protein|nr:hypothetical protein [Solirubrobacteraceae bacterium]